MRKFFAILLISVHTFNIEGYRLLFHFFTEKANRHMVEQLDRNSYNEAELITMKVPLNLPYSSGNWKEFERFDGSVELNGMHYNYVKRKVFNDTLILLCISNNIVKKINEAKDEFAGMAGDTRPSSDGQPGLNLLEKCWLTEYNCPGLPYTLSVSPVWKPGYPLVNDHTVYSSFALLPERPPEPA